MRCKKCSNENRPDAKFCANCGAPLPSESDPVASTLGDLDKMTDELSSELDEAARMLDDALGDIMPSSTKRDANRGVPTPSPARTPPKFSSNPLARYLINRQLVSETGEPRPDAPAEEPMDPTTFDDVAGLGKLRRMLLEIAAIMKGKGPKGLRPWRAVMLFGAPGTGKTLMARALAGELRWHFLAVAGSDLKSRWYGQTEKKLHQLFEDARRHAPAIIFMDEVDTFAGRRDGDLDDTATNQLLQELEGFKASGKPVLFLCATNLPWGLDSAFVSRMERRILVSLPDAAAREQIFQVHARDLPLAKDVDFPEIAAKSDRRSGREIERICQEASLAAWREAGYDADLAQPVRQALFSQAITKNPPSATLELVALQEQWAREHGTEGVAPAVQVRPHRSARLDEKRVILRRSAGRLLREACNALLKSDSHGISKTTRSAVASALARRGAAYAASDSKYPNLECDKDDDRVLAFATDRDYRLPNGEMVPAPAVIVCMGLYRAIVSAAFALATHEEYERTGREAPPGLGLGTAFHEMGKAIVDAHGCFSGEAAEEVLMDVIMEWYFGDREEEVSSEEQYQLTEAAGPHVGPMIDSAFIHEAAHLLLGHVLGSDIGRDRERNQEIEADEFAMSVVSEHYPAERAFLARIVLITIAAWVERATQLGKTAQPSLARQRFDIAFETCREPAAKLAEDLGLPREKLAELLP